MSQNVPDPPHPDSVLADQAFRMAWEWREWLGKFVRSLQFNSAQTGTVTFAAATTAAVTFTNAEPSTSYNVTFDSGENKTFWATSKATTGFTANASSSSSATVGWTLHRR